MFSVVIMLKRVCLMVWFMLNDKLLSVIVFDICLCGMKFIIIVCWVGMLKVLVMFEMKVNIIISGIFMLF